MTAPPYIGLHRKGDRESLLARQPRDYAEAALRAEVAAAIAETVLRDSRGRAA